MKPTKDAAILLLAMCETWLQNSGKHFAEEIGYDRALDALIELLNSGRAIWITDEKRDSFYLKIVDDPKPRDYILVRAKNVH